MAMNENASTVSKTVREEPFYESDFSSLTVERGYEVDVLSQFRANLQQVEDLNLRLRFMLNEVSSLITKS